MSSAPVGPGAGQHHSAINRQPVAVDVKITASGKFTVYRTDCQAAHVMSGIVPDIGVLLQPTYAVRKITVECTLLDEADIDGILKMDARVLKKASWSFVGAKCPFKNALLRLFGRRLGRAITIDRCPLAGQLDSQWFFSCEAVKGCDALGLPAAMLLNGDMRRNVDALIKWLNSTTTGASGLESRLLEMNFPLRDPDQAQLFECLRQRLIQVDLVRNELVYVLAGLGVPEFERRRQLRSAPARGNGPQ